MNELIQNLIEALREELKQYGEMLALLETQQHLVIHRQTEDLLRNVTDVNAQVEAIQAARREREQQQRHVARHLALADDAGFAEITPRLPAVYQPLVQALVEENNELLTRVQQRVRQNHLLLSRAVELMQRFIGTLCPGSAPATYNETGRTLSVVQPPHLLYNAVG